MTLVEFKQRADAALWGAAIKDDGPISDYDNHDNVLLLLVGLQVVVNDDAEWEHLLTEAERTYADAYLRQL